MLGALLRALDQLEEAVQLEQLLPRFLLERSPARECLPRQLDEFDLRVGEPDDAGAAMARAVRMFDAELFEEQDATALACQRVRRGRAHDPGSDHDDLGLQPGQATRFRRTPIPSISSSTTSPRWSQRPSPCSRMQPVPTVPDPRTSPARRRVLRAAWATIASQEWCMSPMFPRERSSPF